MRILFAVTTYDVFKERCLALAKMLRGAGHEIAVAPCNGYTGASNFRVESCSWHEFDVEKIVAFDPNLVIVWNGRYPYMNAGYHWLKQHYRVAVTEMGWYPQKSYSYISDDLAQISCLADVPYEPGVASLPENQSLLEEARCSYQIPAVGTTLPTDFVLVPPQLEHDTQIVNTSPWFKTNDSFLSFIKMKYPHLKVVVRNHPLDLKAARPSFALDMTETCGSLALAQHATLVAGINSTVLAESMLFHRPTLAFGCHVSKNAIGASLDCNVVPKDFKHLYDFYALVLLKNQWDFRNPPGWLIDKISSLDLSPRI